MRFQREEFLLHPADAVYELVRDRFAELLPHLPGVSSIEVLSREAAGKGKTRVKSRWRIRPPALVASLLPDKALVWNENALWTDKKRTVESHIQGYGYESKSKIVYEPASDYTRVTIAVEVRFHPDAVDIPKQNLERIVASAGDALREAVEPNLFAFLEAIREKLSSDT
jgi:hypothetical protein